MHLTKITFGYFDFQTSSRLTAGQMQIICEISLGCKRKLEALRNLGRYSFEFLQLRVFFILSALESENSEM